MKSYVWLTFGFMGWAYYEASGGADFVPEDRMMAVAEAQEDQAPDMVTRASTPTLLAVSASNIVATPAFAEVTPAAAAVETSAETPVIEATAPVVERAPDLREVAGSRVNMRFGPSTDYDVITILDGGTTLEVLEINADGWAKVATVDRLYEGWMAERLLTDPET